MTNGSFPKNGSENYRELSLVSSSECIAWLTVFITESVAIVTINILTMIVFIRNRSLRKRSMYLVINLAFADMLVGGFSEVWLFVEFGDLGCNVWRINGTDSSGIRSAIIQGIVFLGIGASLTNLTAISLERMHATFRPFKHRVIENWVIGVVITITWVTAGLVSTVFEILIKISRVVLPYLSLSLTLVCLFIIFVSYMSIFIKVYWGAHPQHHGAEIRERKLTKTLFIVTLVSLMTWLPNRVSLTLNLFPDTMIPLPLVGRWRLYLSSLILLFANSLVNPILYAIRMPEFRRALFSLFPRHHRQVQVEIPLLVTPGN